MLLGPSSARFAFGRGGREEGGRALNAKMSVDTKLLGDLESYLPD